MVPTPDIESALTLQQLSHSHLNIFSIMHTPYLTRGEKVVHQNVTLH